MVNLLSGVISGTTRRPLIINGTLLTDEGSIVTVKRDNYRIKFSKMSPGRKEIEIENWEELMNKVADNFNNKYRSLLSGSERGLSTFMANVDSFTDAIVLRNSLYLDMLDETDTQHFHDGTFQFSAEIQQLLDDFLLDSVKNYLELYIQLFNRRLTASYMPAIVKGHLAAGLFQPLRVQTRFIPSPLAFGDFSWFFNYINSPEATEEYLEHTSDTSRNLELSVVAMCDLMEKFGLSHIRELNRVQWMYMLLTVLTYMRIPTAPAAMATKFPGIWTPIEQGRGRNGQVNGFFKELLNAIIQLYTTGTI